MRYDGRDDRSLAVDNVQRRVGVSSSCNVWISLSELKLDVKRVQTRRNVLSGSDICACTDLISCLSFQLHCCGVYNYTSWFSSVYFPVSGIPASCCVSFSDCSSADLKNTTLAARKVHKQVGRTQQIVLYEDIHGRNNSRTEWTVRLQGCYELVTSFIESNMGIIAGVIFGIAFSQVRHSRTTTHQVSSATSLLRSFSQHWQVFLTRRRWRFTSVTSQSSLSQLIGMSLACCLSRLINANQYEMVWQVTHTHTHQSP